MGATDDDMTLDALMGTDPPKEKTMTKWSAKAREVRDRADLIQKLEIARWTTTEIDEDGEVYAKLVEADNLLHEVVEMIAKKIATTDA